ncbi:MAG: amidohydrolase [Deltaproteobacteria bacterium]|nr:amidohydrolase [Deltaproteobacteria bacterium]
MPREIEVIDADGHITEEDSQLKEFMEPPYRDRRAVLYPKDNWDRSLGGTLGTRARDAKSWLDAMDQGGISTAVLFPTDGLGIGWIREPDYAVALCKAWNDFVSEKFQKVSPRLRGIALVPLQDVAEGVKEMRRAIKELKLAGVMLPGVGLRKPLGHSDYWPIYEEAERLDCMVGVHATVRGPHYYAAEIFDDFIDVHTLSHAFAQMTQMTSIVLRGVLEKFTSLRIAFMEAGCSWVPYWMGRMNEEWEKRGKAEAPRCKKKPSEYITSGRVYLHAEDYEPLIGSTAEVLSHKVLYYASDWPHWDNEFPENIDHLSNRKDLSPEAKKWLMAETSKKLYKLG